MPYIEKRYRDFGLDQLEKNAISAGELNYLITSIVDEYLLYKGLRYETINEAIGVLECAKLELYRRIASPYEDKKIKINGDVYSAENKTNND